MNKIDTKSAYYDVGGMSTLDIIRAKTSEVTDPFMAFCLGNVIKYICRCPYKGDMERDIDKAIIYLKKLRSMETPSQGEMS